MRQYHIHPSVGLYHGNFHKAINFTISKKGPLANKKYFASESYFWFSFLFVRNIICQNQVRHFCEAVEELGRSIHLNKSKEKFYGHCFAWGWFVANSANFSSFEIRSFLWHKYNKSVSNADFIWKLKVANLSKLAKSEISPRKSLIWKVWAWIVVNWDPEAEWQRVT